MLDLFFGGSQVVRLIFLALCGGLFVFLLGPIFVIVPLSFNSDPYFTFPLAGFSTRWYEAFFASDNWMLALKNSAIVGLTSALVSVVLGTLAALGLEQLPERPRRVILGIFLLPLVMPLIVIAIAVFFAFVRVGVAGTLPGLVLAHVILGAPFVVVTVAASLERFDGQLMRAATILGASPIRAFAKVKLPLILPGVLSGGVFAFVASFDDVVVALFVASTEQRTLPRQMWSGVRENLDPTILSVAAMFVFASAIITILSLWLAGND